ncbi:hypothetical protein [Cohnella cholangitidis]|uniref:DUF6199 domain-containing protein n=1 Tax=Cohnella cholangitidis TaxID=2598458 RepID=A0A7G5C5R2_9BACL|nr:hypothetical protein [Cohnella cholangitidis]QMV44546.1 hypothetical protein FPL14_27775 [Cohnella cholangitidis]
MVIVCLIIAATGIAFFARSYFSESVFYINQHRYKTHEEHGESIRYRSGAAPSVEVQIEIQNRKLIIDGQTYTISRSSNVQGTRFKILYPNGHQYEVDDHSGTLMSVDSSGEPLMESSFYVNGQRVIHEGEERFFPSSLVIAAYSEYHSKQGSPVLFGLSFLLLIYGWCGYRYLRFQKLMFILSLRWIWVRDPEPNVFYYFMCKVGGVIAMIGAVLLALKSL